MQEIVLSRLEASRKELLDLGLRNPLLNYRGSKSRGLHIVQEKSVCIYDILVKQGKAMTFLPKKKSEGAGKEGEEGQLEFLEPTDASLEQAYGDTKLQTEETELTLQNKLLNTYYAARTSLEEQGVNILYIALGKLHWYETTSSEEARLAPLLLIPVSLERHTARERFRIRYTLAELEGNLSLQAKQKAEYGISLPDLPETDDFSLDKYFEEIQEAVGHLPRWKVEQDSIELGFFSFGKFMIYHDLDNAKWPEGSKPAEHEVLQALFHEGFSEPPPSVPEEAFLDDETDANQLFQAVDADSSQVLAMLAVHEGRNLVIQGPPGTGKSQTITNIIANAIGQGKKVLFVSEKMAALEVVKRRLDTIHLGEACLELHSHKANKKVLHEELRRVLELRKPALHHLEQEVVLLEDYRAELNSYSSAVNTEIRQSGLTPYQVKGYLLQLAEKIRNVPLPNIPLPNLNKWDGSTMRRAEALADRIQARLKDIGTPANLQFWGSRLKVLLPHEQERLPLLLQKTVGAVEALQQQGADAAETFGLTSPADRRDSLKLLDMTEILSRQPDVSELAVKDDAWLFKTADIVELLQMGKHLAALHQQYGDIFIAEAWEQDVLEIRQNLLAYGDKWYKFFIGDYRKSNKQLAGLLKVKLPKDTETRLQWVDSLLEAKQLSTGLVSYESLASGLFGRRWQGLNSDWNALTTAATYLAELHQMIRNRKWPVEILNYIEANPEPAVAKQHKHVLTDRLAEHEAAVQELVRKLELDENTRFGGSTFLLQPFEQQLQLSREWIDHLPEIHQVISWNNLAETAAEEGFAGLAEVSISWPIAKDYLKYSLQKAWYQYLLEQAITDEPALRKFERSSHEEAVKQFRRLDLLNLQYNRARAASIHWENIPRLEAGGQVNILRTEFHKKARHMPIRKLMREAGLAIQAIKPVFMMSPLSIANFLPPGSMEFDLVIFDEASQVRPVEALGAILRAKQLVVVGDTKQLPPTSFFDSLTKEVEDEENVTADLQSILGMCDAQGAPQRMLRWHYRSRHESLISLSNHEFYENKLVIFPSPGTKDHMGLVLHHLKDTAYDRGKTRTNSLEASAVADAVMEHARNTPGRTLGVVAFSTSQMQAIQQELELRRRKHPELEDFFQKHAHEPFFVKNLENVQGDERDVIYISIGYGRTSEGYVSMSFGPLNNEGGERRLNVLITRAKLRCEVFTNITADDIDTDRTKNIGIRALKNFLYYAQHGKLNFNEESGRVAESPFEENVALQLERLGYGVRKQVGSQGFYIDLAIVDPEHPGRYLLGIECDGAAYHSARSARDRDRLRQQVLENIGWRIHRIWSTDWFRNPERELKRVVAAIEKAHSMAAMEEEETEPGAQPESAVLLREDGERSGNDLPVYTYAALPSEIANQELHLVPLTKLAGWVSELVKTESPIHFEEAARRMVEAAKITRVGPRIRQSLQEAVAHAQEKGDIIARGDFLWHLQMQQPQIRDRSSFPSTSKKLKFIAPEEINLAVVKVVKDAVAIQSEEAVPLIARLFGFSRVTEDIKQELLQAIEQSLQERVIVQDGAWLRMTDKEV
ncbi:DNA/RNA helicase [Flammeovirgaceae bacterium 311]|nr:DNA/RNA helicase [Flammeovirgaceae bacterium 311]